MLMVSTQTFKKVVAETDRLKKEQALLKSRNPLPAAHAKGKQLQAQINEVLNSKLYKELQSLKAKKDSLFNQQKSGFSDQQSEKQQLENDNASLKQEISNKKEVLKAKEDRIALLEYQLAEINGTNRNQDAGEAEDFPSFINKYQGDHPDVCAQLTLGLISLSQANEIVARASGQDLQELCEDIDKNPHEINAHLRRLKELGF
jgi:predicted RNase H-like nuclease (RuvC/YqgF family)